MSQTDRYTLLYLNLSGERCADAPLVDVVFVHGIRGGPFATWRRVRSPVGAVVDGSAPIAHKACWPSTWLAQDCPRARLLSLEYAAPASGWEVGFLTCHTRIYPHIAFWLRCICHSADCAQACCHPRAGPMVGKVIRYPFQYQSGAAFSTCLE